jgi:hypothetical protein
VQAQSFAKAILTDITASLFLAVLVDERASGQSISGAAVTSRCKRSL